MTRRKRYSAEFKREALRRANEVGVTDVLVAEELGINARNLRNWRDAAKREGENAFPGQGTARDQELMRLKRKLAKVEQERDFLRRASPTTIESMVQQCWLSLKIRIPRARTAARLTMSILSGATLSETSVMTCCDGTMRRVRITSRS